MLFNKSLISFKFLRLQNMHLLTPLDVYFLVKGILRISLSVFFSHFRSSLLIFSNVYLCLLRLTQCSHKYLFSFVEKLSFKFYVFLITEKNKKYFCTYYSDKIKMIKLIYLLNTSLFIFQTKLMNIINFGYKLYVMYSV